jgi:hypothetical protein
MKNPTGFPITYLSHPHLGKLRKLLVELFANPDMQNIAAATAACLREYPLPLGDFPRIEGTYSRTIVHRDDNGFEAMAARWSKGAITSIHGHPPFIFYFVIHGNLKIDDYQRDGAGVLPGSSEIMEPNDHFFSIGKPGRYDNNIHQVQANEETLSIHISSDDSRKGAVFSKDSASAAERQNTHYVVAPLPLRLPAI